MVIESSSNVQPSSSIVLSAVSVMIGCISAANTIDDIDRHITSTNKIAINRFIIIKAPFKSRNSSKFLCKVNTYFTIFIIPYLGIKSMVSNTFFSSFFDIFRQYSTIITMFESIFLEPKNYFIRINIFFKIILFCSSYLYYLYYIYNLSASL